VLEHGLPLALTNVVALPDSSPFQSVRKRRAEQDRSTVSDADREREPRLSGR